MSSLSYFKYRVFVSPLDQRVNCQPRDFAGFKTFRPGRSDKVDGSV